MVVAGMGVMWACAGGLVAGCGTSSGAGNGGTGTVGDPVPPDSGKATSGNPDEAPKGFEGRWAARLEGAGGQTDYVLEVIGSLAALATHNGDAATSALYDWSVDGEQVSVKLRGGEGITAAAQGASCMQVMSAKVDELVVKVGTVGADGQCVLAEAELHFARQTQRESH